MTSGAKTELTVGRHFKKDKINIKNLQSQIRRTYGPKTNIPVKFGTGGSGTLDPIQRLATQGDTMVGPIAFFPIAQTVASGVVDVSSTSILQGYTSRIIALGQGSVADDVDTILGAAFAGQLLILQAVATTPITLKHLTDNIRIPSGNDYIVKGLESVILIFDSTSNEWVLVTGDSGLTNPMTIDLDMGGNSILNTLSLDIEDSAGATKLAISGPLGVGARFQFVAGDSVFFTENITDILEINAAGLDMLNNSISNANDVVIVRDDGTARMSIIGGLTTSTQVIFDLVTNIDWRLSEALSDILFYDSSSNTFLIQTSAVLNGPITSITSSTITLGDDPGDVINFFATANSNLNMGNDNSLVDVNDVGIVRDDGTARMNIIGGLTTSTQVLFDAVTNIDIRFTEALTDVFEIRNSTNQIIMHRPLDMQLNNITSIGTIIVNTTATAAGFRDAGHTTDPTTPIAGELYYNTTSNVYRFYDGTSWADIGGGGASNPLTISDTSLLQIILDWTATPLDNTKIGELLFRSDDSAAANHDWASIEAYVLDNTSTDAEGKLDLRVSTDTSDSLETFITLWGDSASGGQRVIFEKQLDINAGITGDIVLNDVGDQTISKATGSFVLQPATTGSVFFNINSSNVLVVNPTNVAFNVDLDLNANLIDDTGDIIPAISSTYDVGTLTGPFRYDNMYANTFRRTTDMGLSMSATVLTLFASGSGDDMIISADDNIQLNAASVNAQSNASGSWGVFSILATQQVSTNTTPIADLTYSANERDMIQDIWDALVAYGLLDETP